MSELYNLYANQMRESDRSPCSNNPRYPAVPPAPAAVFPEEYAAAPVYPSVVNPGVVPQAQMLPPVDRQRSFAPAMPPLGAAVPMANTTPPAMSLEMAKHSSAAAQTVAVLYEEVKRFFVKNGVMDEATFADNFPMTFEFFPQHEEPSACSPKDVVMRMTDMRTKELAKMLKAFFRLDESCDPAAAADRALRHALATPQALLATDMDPYFAPGVGPFTTGGGGGLGMQVIRKSDGATLLDTGAGGGGGLQKSACGAVTFQAGAGGGIQLADGAFSLGGGAGAVNADAVTLRRDQDASDPVRFKEALAAVKAEMLRDPNNIVFLIGGGAGGGFGPPEGNATYSIGSGFRASFGDPAASQLYFTAPPTAGGGDQAAMQLLGQAFKEVAATTPPNVPGAVPRAAIKWFQDRGLTPPDFLVKEASAIQGS